MFTNTKKTRVKPGPLSPRQMREIRGFKIKSGNKTVVPDLSFLLRNRALMKYLNAIKQKKVKTTDPVLEVRLASAG